MKPISVLLAASLAINATVTALLIARPAATRAFFRDAFVSRATTPAARAPVSKAVPPPREPVVPDSDLFATFDWTNLQASDFPVIMARLTSLGLPPDTVRTLTAILVMKHYEDRKRAVRPQADPSEYWRNPHPRHDPKDLAALRELDREKNKALRELVGPGTAEGEQPRGSGFKFFREQPRGSGFKFFSCRRLLGGPLKNLKPDPFDLAL